MLQINPASRSWFALVSAGVIAAAAGYVSCGSQPDEPIEKTESPLYEGPPLSGAIFTTTVDGAIVNENVHYLAKEDVYLDGGPGLNAPATAAALPEGDYYFQVTDPSGKDLLSTDHISCRKIHINEFGVISQAYPGKDYVWSQGSWVQVDCQHETGIDQDHADLGAITVQLMPYDDTPNKGGVYKAWITPVDAYAGDPDLVPVKHNDALNGENWQPGNVHGFIPRYSKTDNYKVKGKRPPCEASTITVRKFDDANMNGVKDAGEPEVTGWSIEITDPTAVTNNYYTPAVNVVAAMAGNYSVVEDVPDGVVQTAAYVDGVPLNPVTPTVVVAVENECEETHEVLFGNAGLGSAEVCKVYDVNGNGEPDAGEPGVAGWRMSLTGTDVLGNSVGPIVQTTGEDGCTTFGDLAPGTYTVQEVMPVGGDWIATGNLSETFTIASGLTATGSAATKAHIVFTNLCITYADFDTKGYWHNKNGLSELTEADRDYVNGLDPYDDPTSYFGAGDEPFDGMFENGDPVAAAYNNDDASLIWGAGTWQAEVSHFLVDANAGGDPREQLAQQLLAFIFNTRHNLGDPSAPILLNGSLVSAQALITQAIAIWQSGTAAEQTAMQELLDALNNNDALPVGSPVPCEVTYP